MRRPIAVATLFALLVCGGCETISPAGYFWGDHARTYYAYEKAPSEQTLAAHVKELERILMESEERGLKAPPGINAELGYFRSKADGDTDATAQYEREMQLYPESSAFLQRLLAQDDQ
ncbi:MAG TPA: DUF4810 domain-containing protein [Pseudomonadales bacterium]|nr:DUF4810 domain-containing protein [Pseudomonadales bacterium]